MRVCVLVHYFDGVDVKGRRGGASGLTGGSLAAGDSPTPGKLSCYCLANSELIQGKDLSISKLDFEITMLVMLFS